MNACKPDLVSTVIPVFNRPAQLRQAVASAMAQDYRPIEIVIVDDGSSDDTFEVCKELASAHPAIVRAVTQANGGPGAARERGRLLAQGEFIQYLDSDDVLLPGKFTAQVAALRRNAEADVAYGITFVRDGRGELRQTPHKKTGEAIAAMFPEFLLSRWWETATPLYRTSVTNMAGPWTDLRLEEDWEYDCRIASLGGKLAWVPQAVSEHHEHQGIRLSIGTALDPSRLKQRARSHTLIFAHAQRARMGPDASAMQQFARSLFLLARQCGAAGLANESLQLFELSRQACGEGRSRGLDYRVYRAAAALAGWTFAGKASLWLDAARAWR